MGFFDSIKEIVNAIKGEQDEGDKKLMEEVNDELYGKNDRAQKPGMSPAMQEAMQRQREAQEMIRNGQKGKMDYLMESATFIMLVEDVFSITGRGIVATGKVYKGSASVGDAVKIAGLEIDPVLVDSSIVAIEQFRKMCDTANAGENVGIFLSGISRKDVARGYTILKVN